MAATWIKGSRGEDARRRRAVVTAFETRFADPESVAYARMHAPRYEILLGAVQAAIAGSASGPVGLLDVGPSFQTEAIRELYPSLRVDSLGFADARFPPPRDWRAPYRLRSQQRRRPHDVARDRSVRRHRLCGGRRAPAHVSGSRVPPVRVAGAIRGTLVLQTPNAAALSRRFWLLAGRNPYEPIREDKRQAGALPRVHRGRVAHASRCERVRRDGDAAGELLPDRIAEESRSRASRRSPAGRPAAGDNGHRDEALVADDPSCIRRIPDGHLAPPSLGECGARACATPTRRLRECRESCARRRLAQWPCGAVSWEDAGGHWSERADVDGAAAPVPGRDASAFIERDARIHRSVLRVRRSAGGGRTLLPFVLPFLPLVLLLRWLRLLPWTIEARTYPWGKKFPPIVHAYEVRGRDEARRAMRDPAAALERGDGAPAVPGTERVR